MARTKTSKKAPMRTGSLLSHQFTVLKIIIVAAALGAIAFFREFVGEVVFSTVGFAVVLGLVWVGVFALMVWSGKWSAGIRKWNVLAGTLMYTAAAWGVLSLLYPAFAIGDVEFDSVSLGGELGEYIVGNQGVGLIPEVRLALMVLGGTVFVAPRMTLQAARSLARGVTWSLASLFGGLGRLFSWSGHQIAQLVRGSQALGKKMLAGLTGILSPRPRAVPGTPLRLPSETARQPDLALKPVSQEKRRPDFVDQRKDRSAPVKAGEQLGRLPTPDLLEKAAEAQLTGADNHDRARKIEEALASYGVEARVVQINPGPSVTQFGVEPGWDRKYKKIVEKDEHGRARLDKDGNPIERSEEISKTRVKVERITALANNLALALASPSIRIEAPVPGKSLVGIEVPNTSTSIVQLRSILESQTFQKARAKSSLALGLGKGSAGEPVVADLAKMPHLLIAGETGSGKTVCINSIISCLLMNNLPGELRLLLIDPKRVELVSFSGVPHLLSPVVVETDKAIDALRRLIKEMDSRYSKFAAVGARNIDGYNRNPLVTEPLPYIVAIVDELAHLMMSAAEVAEPTICRLAQLSRATGIHLIIATQRPSVDVVTGLIKANFPTRIAFAVSSIVDSRTILDTGGAEKLLGRGDMLYMPPDAAKPKRLRGCFVSDAEIDRIAKFWVQQVAAQPLDDSVAKSFASISVEESRDEDPLLEAARRLARDTSHLSTSFLQRRLHIGYPRAARIMDTLEQEGFVGGTEPDRTVETIEPYEEEE